MRIHLQEGQPTVSAVVEIFTGHHGDAQRGSLLAKGEASAGADSSGFSEAMDTQGSQTGS